MVPLDNFCEVLCFMLRIWMQHQVSDFCIYVCVCSLISVLLRAFCCTHHPSGQQKLQIMDISRFR